MNTRLHLHYSAISALSLQPWEVWEYIWFQPHPVYQFYLIIASITHGDVFIAPTVKTSAVPYRSGVEGSLRREGSKRKTPQRLVCDFLTQQLSCTVFDPELPIMLLVSLCPCPTTPKCSEFCKVFWMLQASIKYSSRFCPAICFVVKPPGAVSWALGELNQVNLKCCSCWKSIPNLQCCNYAQSHWCSRISQFCFQG